MGDAIHAGIELNDSARVFKIDDVDAHLLHFSYVSPQHYLEKSNRYTAIEARALFNKGEVYTFKNALKDCWDAFWKRYVKKGKGHKDGEWGFIYCVWTAVYKLNTYAKYILMKKYQTAEYVSLIEKNYDQIIAAALKEFSENQDVKNS